jgi:1,4-alpha-glucan branching enzyme
MSLETTNQETAHTARSGISESETIKRHQFNDFDRYLFLEGTHTRLYDKLGASVSYEEAEEGVRFAVWAPNARQVYVTGEFNGWNPHGTAMITRENSGVWEAFIAAAQPGQSYKYFVDSPANEFREWRTDPFARYFKPGGGHESIIWQSKYKWQDESWLKQRVKRQSLDQPINIYELHAGSWKRQQRDHGWDFMSYRDLAEILPDYLKKFHYTHVELMPTMEHPFYGSWGYQITGYFAPTNRYGTPDDFKYLVDTLHQAGIGVILDWVPSHFPGDTFALYQFDGSPIYEYADPRKGFHRDWNSFIFDYGRPEVRSFLISNAMFWLDEYHIDGLRVDAVASMLYLDYSREHGDWVPNQYGGRENLEAISFLKQFNETVHKAYPDVLTIAEESTAWPQVSRPVSVGGLGFSLKWDMGWMHDTLQYFTRDTIYRQHHQNEITFRSVYAFNENFVLSISHDEVVYGKQSLLSKMPGDEWQKFANLRTFFAYMTATPGKKLIFMGSEFGQEQEWNHDRSLDWHQLQSPKHINLMSFVESVNELYIKAPAFYETDVSASGFQWVDQQDHEKSILSFLRKSYDGRQVILCVFNLKPVTRTNYRLGVPHDGYWQEVLNSDATFFGGSGIGNYGGREATPIPYHGLWHSLSLTLPPLAAVFFKWGDDI